MFFYLICSGATKADYYLLNKRSLEIISRIKKTRLCQEVILKAFSFLLRHALCATCSRLVKFFEVVTLRDMNNAARVFIVNMLPCRRCMTEKIVKTNLEILPDKYSRDCEKFSREMSPIKLSLPAKKIRPERVFSRLVNVGLR